MTSYSSEVTQALIDVRNAYRLLHDYQRAVLDAVRYIGAQLGFAYAGGYPNFSDCTPREGKGSLDNWAWDWLNLYFHDFHFVRNKEGDEALNLSIWLFSDTGFYASEHPSPDETDITTFAKAEESGTKIGFILYRHWRKEYNFIEDDEAVRSFLKRNGELPQLLKEAGICAMIRDFSFIVGQESTDALLDELVQFGQTNGFLISRSHILVDPPESEAT